MENVSFIKKLNRGKNCYADHMSRDELQLIHKCSCTVEKHKAKQRQPVLPLFRSQGNAIEKFIAVCYT